MKLAGLQNRMFEQAVLKSPKLMRGRVWCRHCGRGPIQVNSTECLKSGWPKCCSSTMTIDSPEEQIALKALEAGDG